MVCKDGPVFDLQALSNMNDFGKHSLLKSGMKVSLKEYADWKSCWTAENNTSKLSIYTIPQDNEVSQI